MLFTKENFDQLLGKDIDTFTKFDDNGLLIGPDESIENYVSRLLVLSKNINEFDQELSDNGSIELMDIPFNNDDAIGADLFEQANTKIKELYDIKIGWVPGFFSDHKMGVLFAGCAIYSFQDFFAIFIIRNAFKLKEKWLIYSRTELIAHELCHIAHIGFNIKNYEEFFAYQTATSLFRRLCGGVLRTTTDTYLVLSAVVFLFIAQLINISTRSPMEWQQFPMPLVFAITAMILSYVIGRYVLSLVVFYKAKRNLLDLYNTEFVLPILFRCSAVEIKDIARANKQDLLRTWIENKANVDIRWQVILRKYSQNDS